MSRLIHLFRVWLPYAILVLSLAFYPLVGVGQVLVGIVNTTPVAIAYRALYLLLSLILLLFYLPNISRHKIPLVVPSLMLFWAFYVVRIFNDILIEGITIGYTRKGLLFFLTYGLGGCLIPAIVTGLAAKNISYNRLTNYLLFFFTLCNLALLFFLFLENGFSSEIFYHRLRVGDSVVSPIALSQYGGALLITAASSWLIVQKKHWVLPVLMGLGTMMIVLGSSRGPLVAAVGCIALLVADHFWQHVKTVMYWVYASVALVVLIWMVAVFVVPNLERINILNRVSTTVEDGAGLDAREAQWSAAWSQFINSPIWGDALVENAYNFYPHNMILEVLISTGILGVLALLPAAGILLWKYFNRRHYEPEKRVYFYLFFFFFGCAMFSLSLITIAHVWILWALAAALPRKNPITIA